MQPDVLIAEAGALEVHRVFSGCQNLKQVMLVTKPGNEHMDFAEDAEMAGSKLKVSTWHDLVEENKSLALSEVPPVDRQAPSPSLSLIESSDDTTSVVEYTSEVSISPIPHHSPPLTRLAEPRLRHRSPH